MNRRHVLCASIAGAVAASGVASGASSASASTPATPRTSPRASQRARVRRGYVEGPFGQIHYYEAGAGAPLVLLHQSPVCGRMFERALPHLAQAGIRAIALDTPGFGNSDVPDAPPSVTQYADALGAALDGLGLFAPHILGHHTGAGIACNFVARHGARARSLILNGPPVFTPEALAAFKDHTLAPLPVYKDGSHLQERWDKRVAFSPGWSDEVAMHRRLVDQMWAGDTWWYGHAAAFAYDMAPDLMAVRAPSLILTNTGDDIYDLALRARDMRPDMAFVELEGGTHDIVDEQPHAWSRAVAAFVHAHA